MANKSRRIGIIGYEGVQGLDLVGPLDAFSAANGIASRPTVPYETVLIGVREGAFRAESGVQFLANATLENVPSLDTVIIPGGRGIRLDADVHTPIIAWLRKNAHRVRRVCSICTGIYALAESGLLDGRRATTHWRFAGEAATRWPNVRIEADAIFTKDAPYYTSAGITAGIDLSLSLIEEDLGNSLALAVARELVVYLKRSGGQLQYSDPLRGQTRAGEEFSDVVAWMLDNLGGDLSVETLADRTHLSTRHFNRKFKAVFGETPADFVEALRLDEARWLLSNDELTIENLAKAVGYSGGDVFRRAFERRFGVVPSDYRERFG